MDLPEPILEAVEVQRAVGIAVAPIAQELDGWQIGCFTFLNAELLRLAKSRGLVEAA